MQFFKNIKYDTSTNCFYGNELAMIIIFEKFKDNYVYDNNKNLIKYQNDNKYDVITMFENQQKNKIQIFDNLFNAKTNEIVEELKIRCLFLIQSNSILNKKLNNMKDNKKKIFLKNAEYECLSFYVNSMIEQQLPIDNELLAKI